MIFEILKDAVDYSQQDTKKLLQLSILYIFGFLIIPLLIAEGYYYRIQQQSLKGVINFIEPLPEFNNYTNLLSNGFRVILTKLFYIIPCVLVLIIGILVGALGISFYLFILFTILLWLVIFFLFLISTPHMVYNNGDVIKTLNIMEIINIIKSIGVKTYLELYIDIINYLHRNNYINNIHNTHSINGCRNCFRTNHGIILEFQYIYINIYRINIHININNNSLLSNIPSKKYIFTV